MSDKQRFSNMMDDLALIYGREVTPALKRIYWDDLSACRIDILEAAASAHRKDSERGRFFPKPADLIAQVEKASPGDGRADSDEAWSICLASFDEGETVCVTSEIMTAREVATPVMDAGDKVGARMAFKAAYDRSIAQSRRLGDPCKWFLSIGHDASRREDAIKAAVDARRLTADETRHLLPAPIAGGPVADIAGLIAGKVVEFPKSNDAVARQHLAKLREALTGGAKQLTPKTDAEVEAEKARAAQWIDEVSA